MKEGKKPVTGKIAITAVFVLVYVAYAVVELLPAFEVMEKVPGLGFALRAALWLLTGLFVSERKAVKAVFFGVSGFSVLFALLEILMVLWK